MLTAKVNPQQAQEPNSANNPEKVIFCLAPNKHFALLTPTAIIGPNLFHSPS
jgi:hypothetical protein